MAITIDQTAPISVNTGTTSSIIVTFGTNPSASSTAFILVWAGLQANAVTPTDNGSPANTWTQDAMWNSGAADRVMILRCNNPNPPASSTLAVTLSFGSTDFLAGCGASFLGVQLGAPETTGGSQSSATVTTWTTSSIGTKTGELLLAAFVDNNSVVSNGYAATSPATLIAAANNGSVNQAGGAAYLIGNAPQSITWTGATQVQDQMIIAAYPSSTANPIAGSSIVHAMRSG